MGEILIAIRRRLLARWPRFWSQFQRLHARYARLFWTLHSIWALLTGAAVLVLAHNRYGFVPWVLLFLALTWGSTLLFSQFASMFTSRAMRFAQGFVSYLTRVMYQETLFFLIPFYSYSTTFPSPNSVWVFLLAGLAILSCFDLVFDRLLRTSRLFALGFFAVVSFSALQFFFPLLLGVRVHLAAYLAAVLAVLAAAPLAFRWHELRRPRHLAALALAMIVSLGVVRLLRPIVPPVPLRLIKLRFAASIEPRTMTATQEYSDTIPSSVLTSGRIYAIATVFAPTDLRTSVTIRFFREGSRLRTSRTVDLIAHPRGFRVYDALLFRNGIPKAGDYTVEVWTAEGQLIGRGRVTIV